jgi:uncharacterized delta-60 repeat protein
MGPETTWSRRARIGLACCAASAAMAALAPAASGAGLPRGIGPVSVVAQAAGDPGTPDDGFGSGGTVSTSFGNATTGHGVALQDDGMAVVGVSGSAGAGVARFTTTGAVDTGYGTDGRTIDKLPAGETTAVYAVAIDHQGRAVVTGQSGSSVLVARYTTGGVLDTSFAAAGAHPGYVTIAVGGGPAAGNAIAVRSDDGVVVAGFASGGLGVVAQLTPSGTLDTTFGPGATTPGVVTTGAGGGQAFWSAVALQGDKVLVGGLTTLHTNHHSAAIARFTAAGALDATFADGGPDTGMLKVLPPGFGDGDISELRGLALDAGGAILATGLQDSQVLVARYTADGAVPASGWGGASLLGGTDAGDEATGATILPRSNGGAIVTGDLLSGTPPNPFVMLAVRLGADGLPDPAFGDDAGHPGFERIPFSDGNARVGSGALAPDDKVLLAGMGAYGTTVALSRLNGDRPAMQVEPQGGGPDLPFGDQTTGTTSDAHTITVRNVGNADLHMGLVSIASSPDGPAFDVPAACDPAVVHPGGTCAIDVTFTPSASRAYAITIQIESDAPGSPAEVESSGRGVPGPDPATPGALVPRYGADGVALDDIADHDRTVPIVTLPGGGALVGFTAPGIHPAITRLTSSGAVDDAFDTTAAGNGFASDLAVDGQGRPVLAGESGDAMYVARFTPDGQLDPTFAAGGPHPGYTTIPATGSSVAAQALAIRPDDGIVLAGLGSPTGNPATTLGVVAELTPGGTLDPAFGPAGTDPGIVSTDDAFWSDVIMQGDKVVVAGHAGGVGQLRRFTAAGEPDTSFAAGGTSPGTLVVRDATLGSGGTSLEGVAADDGGRLLAIGTQNAAPAPTKLLVGRYTADGEVPAGTWGGAATFAAFAGRDTYGAAVLPRPQGKVVLVGSAQDEFGSVRTLSMRLRDDGTLDPAWGTDAANPGVTFLRLGQGENIHVRGAMRPDDRLLVATGPSSGPGVAVALFTGDPAQLGATAAGGATTIDFGDQQPGTTSASHAVTLENTGDALVHVSAITADGDFTVADPDGCATKDLAPRATCAVGVAFAPQAAGDATGALTIASDAPGSPITLALAGHGLTAGDLVFDPAALDFGTETVGTRSAAKSVTVRNAGEAGVHITGVRSGAAGFAASFPADAGTCAGVTLAHDETCAFAVAFEPKAAGPATATVAIDGDRPATLAVSGVGAAVVVAPPPPPPAPAGTGKPELEQASLDFAGHVAGSPTDPREATLRNTGTAPLHVKAITSSTPSFTVDPRACAGAEVPAGGSCAFAVTFAPPGVGPQAGTVTVDTDAGAAALAVTGIGDKVPGSPGGDTVPSKDVKVDAQVTDKPAAPGDATTVTAAIDTPTNRPAVSYLWSTDGPDPSNITVDTGNDPHFRQRPGPRGGAVYVWAVDDQGKVSQDPAKVDVEVPQGTCPAGEKTGDLKLSWLHIRSSACVQTGAPGYDYVVPLDPGGASINGLEVSCPSSGKCGALTIKGTDFFVLKSTSKVHLTLANGQGGTTDLGEQTIDFDAQAAFNAWQQNKGKTAAAPARAATVKPHPPKEPGHYVPPLPPKEPPVEQPRPELAFLKFFLPAGQTLGSLKVHGEASLALFNGADGEPGVKITANTAIEIPGTAPVEAPVSQEANVETGPETESEGWELNLSGLMIGPLLRFDALILKYEPYVAPESPGAEPRYGVFEFDSAVGILVTGWTVGAAGVFSATNGFESMELFYERNTGKGTKALSKKPASGPKPNASAPVNGATQAIPVKLDALDGHFQLHPYLAVGGDVTVEIGGEYVVGGGFDYAAAHQNSKGEDVPFQFLLTAYFPLATDITMGATVYVTGPPQVGVGVKGTFIFEIAEVFRADVSVSAYFAWSEPRRQVLVEFSLSGRLVVLGSELASATGIINNDYLAGCGQFLGTQIWGAVTLANGDFDWGMGGCDNIAEYSFAPALAGLSRRQPHGHAAVTQLRIPAGLSAADIELTAADGVARGQVKGPGQTDIVSPAEAGIHAASHGAITMVDPKSHRTVIGLDHPKAGVYEVSTVPGAARIVKARVAYAKPATVTGRITGRGNVHELRYKVDGASPTTKVEFVERSGGVGEPIGTATGAKGVLRFRSQFLPGRKRTIVARISVDGVTRPNQTIGSYVATPVRLAVPGAVRIGLDRKRARATVTWAKVAGASTYEVRVRTHSGRRQVVTTSARSLVLKSIYPGEQVAVQVRGITSLLDRGPAGRATLAVAKVKRR